jgi:hypothetical protein
VLARGRALRGLPPFWVTTNLLVPTFLVLRGGGVCARDPEVGTGTPGQRAHHTLHTAPCGRDRSRAASPAATCSPVACWRVLVRAARDCEISLTHSPTCSIRDVIQDILSSLLESTIHTSRWNMDSPSLEHPTSGTHTQRVIYTGCSMEAVSRSSPIVYTLFLQQEFFTHTDLFHTPVVASVVLTFTQASSRGTRCQQAVR